MKVLITGAGGFLGSELIRQLLIEDTYEIYAYTSQKDMLIDKFDNNKKLICYDFKDWKKGYIPFDKLDILIHCAFPRISDGKELVKSLDFTNEFISDAISKGVGGVVNISSQSVYSQKRQIPASESSEINPGSLYGFAKYSTELLISKICDAGNIAYTNLRLASLMGEGLDTRLTNRFVRNAIDGKKIRITGGKQVISYMHVRDAVEGLIALLSLDTKKWKSVYNLGTEESYRLIEIANIISKISPEFISNEVKVEIENGNDFINLSLDCTGFYNDTLWKAKYDMENSIRDIFQNTLRKIRLEEDND